MAVKKLELVPPPPPEAEAQKKPGRWDQVLIAAAGRYKALKKLCDGGTAEIFLGEHVGAEGYRRLVILKRLHAAFAARAEFSRMLVEEAAVASNLRHGNIVEVRDLGTDHGRSFLVLEVVDGWSLAQLLERARRNKLPMPPRVAVHIVAEIARALQHAHDRGIVHCDICPHNILVSETGEVKLTDFGIARMPHKPVQPGMIAGKPSYMSPEQAKGEALDARSDVFSLGTVLYYALTDVLPFKGASDEEVIARVAKGEFELPTKHRPGLPKELGQLLSATMQPEPWARYQTAHELLAACELVLRSDARSELERWMAALYEKDKLVPPTREKGGRPVPLKVVRTPVTKPLIARFARSKRWLMAAAMLAVLALGADRAWKWVGSAAAATLMSGVHVEEAAPPEVEAVKPFEGGEVVAAAVAGGAPEKSTTSEEQQAAEPVVMGTVGDVEVIVQEQDITIAPEAELPDLKVSAKVDGLYDQDRAMVQLFSEPAGADVVIDGRVLGTTPVKLRFRTGIPFEIQYLREGNAPLTKWMTVERPKAGGVRVQFSEPR